MLLSSVKTKHVWVAILSVVGLTTLAWTDRTDNRTQAYIQNRDTIPSKGPKNSGIYDDRNEGKDIDQRIEQLEKAIESLNAKIEQKDWQKMQQKLEASLSKIDVEKIQKQVDEAMKKVDMKQAMLEAQNAMKKVNWEEIQKEIKAAMANASWRE